MRSWLSGCLIFCLFLTGLGTPGLNAYSADISDYLDEFTRAATVENTARFACLPEYDPGVEFRWQYSNICPIVRESEVCSDVSEEEALKCEDHSENELDVTSFGFLYHCARGLWTSFTELLSFIKNAILGAIGYLSDGETRGDAHEAMGEYYDSFSNYIALEFDEAMDETDSEFKAAMLLAARLIKRVFSALADLIQEQFYALGCYNQEARQKRVCKIIGDVIIPPAAAVALAFKGPGYIAALRNLPKLSGAFKDRLKLAPKDAPVLRRPARELSPDEVKSQRIKRLSERMTATMKTRLGVGLAAPQIGEGLRLLVMKKKNGETVTMANPVVTPLNEQTKKGLEGCLSLPGLACSVERSQNVEVSYTNLEGERVVETFKKRDAVVVQHEVDHLDGELMAFRSSDFAGKFGLKNAKNLSETRRESLGRWLFGLSDSEKKRLKNYKKTIDDDLKSFDDPLSFTYSLREAKGIESGDDAIQEALKLHSIRVRDGPDARRFKDINQWVRSEAHALYLYDSLASQGLDKNADILRYLNEYNEYFQKARGTRGPPAGERKTQSLVSYSFEKESSSKDISLWYKDAKYSDEEWLALPEAERLTLIKKATNVKKNPVSYDRIAPTELRPHYLGRYTEELGDSQRKGYTWEITHKKYEIDRERLFSQMDELKSMTGETHSFHTHVVFDLPKGYERFDDFSMWAKHTNDYLYLRGMEEGLHGNYLVNIARFSDEWAPRSHPMVSNKMPTRQGGVGKTSHKFFTMGIRADMYGKSPLKGMQRMGLELRDPTRKMDELREHVDSVSEAVSTYRWESMPAKSIDRSEVGFLRPGRRDLRQKLAEFIDDPEVVNLMVKAEPNASIALQNFEELKYVDYKNGQLISPSPEKVEQIVKARDHFIAELKKTAKELREIKDKGEALEKDDVEMVMRMDMTTWAKEAKISELFQQ